MSRVPTVSVLMTSYNREAHIADAIESVLAQWYEDFELLIVDNCSTDRSVEIAREYATKDRRIRVHVNDRNLGQFGNRNRAAELARGVLMKYHDSDDLMYPHCLAVMVPPLLAEPRAGLGLSLSKDFPGGPCPMLLTPRMSYQRDFLSTDRMFLGGPACGLFRTDVFLKHGGFEDRGMPSDNLFWLKVCARENVLALPADLFWYRRHAGQLLASPQAAMQYTIVPGERLRALDAAECPLTAEEREEARKGVVLQALKESLADVRARRWNVARARMRHVAEALPEWRRYVRRPHRESLIGTPLDARGEFLVPDWKAFGEPAGAADSRHAAAVDGPHG